MFTSMTIGRKIALGYTGAAGALALCVMTGIWASSTVEKAGRRANRQNQITLAIQQLEDTSSRVHAALGQSLIDEKRTTPAELQSRTAEINKAAQAHLGQMRGFSQTEHATSKIAIVEAVLHGVDDANGKVATLLTTGPHADA